MLSDNSKKVNLPEIFNFNSYEVRILTDETGEPWFVASDVCKILELKNTSKAVSSIKDNQKNDITLSDTVGKKQSYTIISEPGLYKLVMKSRKKEAEIFQDWITEKVLPEIRKTGSYKNPKLTQAEILLQSVQLLVNLEKRQDRLETEVNLLRENQERAKSNLQKEEKTALLPFNKPIRAKIRRRVGAYCVYAGITPQEAYTVLYREFLDRYGIDLKTRAKNRNTSGLEEADKAGKIEELWSLACFLFSVDEA